MGLALAAQTVLGLILITWGVIRIGSECFASVLGDPGDSISIPRTLFGLGAAIAGAFILII